MTKTVSDAENRLFAGAPLPVLPGAEPKEQTAEERWNSAGIGNAFIFGKVMSANPDLLLELRDGSSKIVLNATGNNGAISPSLKDFLDLVMGVNKNKDLQDNEEKQGMTYADRVQEKVRIAKLNSGLRREFMNWEMTLLVERNKGHAEGLSDGEILKLVKQIRKKLSLHQSEEKIADDLVEDISLVHTICELIKRMPDENDEGVLQEYKQNYR